MGSISMIFQVYAEANNEFLKLHNRNKPTSYIIYLDTNNLCGHYMMQLLSFEELNWADPEKFNLDNYSDDGSIGCFLQH